MATNPSTVQGNVLTVERPEQLKALGHPLRIKVLQVLGEKGEALTNRELAARLGVDPGHLHFHVRMLHRAGLIELASGGRGREKPYKSVAPHLLVAPEFRVAGLTGEVQTAMLEEIRRGWEAFGAKGEFRSAQITARIDPEQVRQLVQMLVERVDEIEDDACDVMILTLVAHPATDQPAE